jgi:hypothetical protein
MIKNKIYFLNYYLFYFLVTVIWILIIVSLLGLSKIAPSYIIIIGGYVRLYVCLFLIIRFNPIYNFQSGDNFTELDKKISYSAGLAILTTDSLFIKYVDQFLYYIKGNNTLQKDTNKKPSSEKKTSENKL